MNSDTTRNSEQLRKEVLTQIDKVDTDIDQIERRLTPGQLIDDAIFESRGRNLQQTFDHLKDNPIGTSFLTLGTLMLMEDDSHRSYETVAKNKVSTETAHLKSTAARKTDSVKESFNSAKSKISAKVNEASRKMDSMKEDAQRSVETKASSAVDKAKEVSRDLQSSFGKDSSPSSSRMDIGRNTGIDSGIKENVSESLSSAKREIRSEVEQMDGTSFMAIGLGLGVLTSASLPVSDTESEFVSEHAGDSLEKFRNDLRDAFNESTTVLKNKVLSDLKDIPIRF